jgi:hypothetical protein
MKHLLTRSRVWRCRRKGHPGSSLIEEWQEFGRVTQEGVTANGVRVSITHRQVGGKFHCPACRNTGMATFTITEVSTVV